MKNIARITFIIISLLALNIPLSFSKDAKIVLYGHSFLADREFSLYLSSVTGLNVYNFARGGSSSQEAAFISGGEDGYFVPYSGVIPKKGEVILIPSGIMSEHGAMWPGFFARVRYAGVDGILYSKKSDKNGDTSIVFKRDGIGTDIFVNEPTKAEPYMYTRADSGTEPAGKRVNLSTKDIFIIWVGRNTAGGNIRKIMRDIKNITKTLNGNSHYLIMPEFPYDSEMYGTPGRNNINQLNGLIKKNFPDNYCLVNGKDALRNFILHMNPSNPQDKSDSSKGLTPSSLRSDNIHPSNKLKNNALFIGVHVNADFIKKCLTDKHWLEE